MIIGSDEDGIRKLNDFIGTHFQTKNLDNLKYILRDEVSCGLISM